jgi:hypothetical protein
MSLRENLRTNPLGLNIFIGLLAASAVSSLASAFWRPSLVSVGPIIGVLIQGALIWGLLRRAEWARMLVTVLLAIMLLLTLPSAVALVASKNLPLRLAAVQGIVIAFSGGFLFYCWRPAIRRLFNGGEMPVRLTTKRAMTFTAAVCGTILLVVGVAGFVAIRSFASIIDKKKEAHPVYELGSLRSAIAIYYGDHEGVYPASFDDLADRYWPHGSRPKLWGEGCRLFHHPETTEWMIVKSKVLTDSGRWGYVYNPGAKDHGEIYIDCTHRDSKSKLWYDY